MTPKVSEITHVASRASLVAQTIKNLPAMRKTWLLSMGREDHLEKRVATCSSVLAWRIPRTEEPGGLQGWTRLTN